MLLKIIGLIVVKVLDVVYLVYRGIFEDSGKRWILVGGGCFLTLAAYFIFRAVGVKHPIVCIALISCPWVLIYDIIGSKSN